MRPPSHCCCSEEEQREAELVTTVGGSEAPGLSFVEGEESEECQPEDLLQQQEISLTIQGESQHSIRQSTTFGDREGVLRATNVQNVLCRGGSIFHNSAGTAETYLLSSVATRIHVFISHNWVVPRREKFWALALHFNVLHAAAVSYAGIALGCLLNALSTPPTLRNEDLIVRPYCLTLGACTFFLALLVGHDVPLMGRLFCHRQVFLDKICIHQTDPVLKREGITKLGAFLRYSDRMLVLFHSLYVQKLWTVYELACFMALHRRDKLDVLPLGIAKVTLQCTGMFMVFQGLLVVGIHVGSMHGIASTARLVAVVSLAGLCTIPLSFILRAWALQQSILFNSLRSFELSKAQCHDESDRPIVSSNICAFVRSMGLAEDSASDAEVLQIFDRLVQEEMPEHLRSAVGRTGFPYKYAVLAGAAIQFYTLDIISSQKDAPASFVLAWFAYGFNVQTGVLPVLMFILAWISNKCPPLGRRLELALRVGSASLAILGMMCAYLLSTFFRSKAELDVWWFLPYAAVSALEVLVLSKLF